MSEDTVSITSLYKPSNTVTKAKTRTWGFTFWLCVAWLVLLVLAAIFVKLLPLYDVNNFDFLAAGNATEKGASWTDAVSKLHPLGVDDSGVDLLSYVIHAARISLMVGFGSAAVGLFFGGWLGLMAGYFKGFLDQTLTFITNALLSIPPLLFLLLLVSVVASTDGGVSVKAFISVVGALSIPIFFRVVRAATLQQAEREYVVAAKTLGAKRIRIIIKEILPNVIKPTLAYALITVGAVIVVEGSLSLLGAGLGTSTMTWGRMFTNASGIERLRTVPNATFVPGVFVFLTVFSLNYIGDQVRAKLEVKQGGI